MRQGLGHKCWELAFTLLDKLVPFSIVMAVAAGN